MLSTSTLSFRGLAMALALVAGVAVASDASAMSRKDKRTLVGAVVGGVAGNLLSNGDPAATVGGAVAGGGGLEADELDAGVAGGLRQVAALQELGKSLAMHIAAAFPLALSVGHADGRLKRGQLVVAEAIGGGAKLLRQAAENTMRMLLVGQRLADRVR